jgi:hypothetical protein
MLKFVLLAVKSRQNSSYDHQHLYPITYENYHLTGSDKLVGFFAYSLIPLAMQ